MVDIDGVISLFGSRQPDGAASPAVEAVVEGRLHSIDGMPHFLSSTAATHLLALEEIFELVWASGWEEKANEHLPRLLGLPGPLPFLRFERGAGARGSTRAHWKLESIESYAGGRPLAWIDDAFNADCHDWAENRLAPTLLVSTVPERGLTAREAQLLLAWAAEHAQTERHPD